MLDPFAGAQRLANGALFYKVEDSELSAVLNDDEKLRAEYEKLSNFTVQPLEFSEEEEDELMAAMVNELQEESPLTVDEFN